MSNQTSLSNETATLLLRKQELEIQNDLLLRQLSQLQQRRDLYMHTLTYGKSREESIRQWERKLYFYFQRPTVTMTDVASFLHIDLAHLLELVENQSVAFDYCYFPSSPRGDYYFVTLESLAIFVVDHVVDHVVEVES